MKKLIVLILCLVYTSCHPSRQINKTIGCLDVDVVLLVDISSSVRGKEEFLTNAITSLTSKFKGTGVRIALITFATSVTTIYHLGEDMGFIIVTGGSTNLDSGVDAAVEELYGEHSILNNKKSIIIISDGAPADRQSAINSIDRAKLMNITIFGVLVASSDKNFTFMESVSDIYVETDYELLGDELKKLDICL